MNTYTLQRTHLPLIWNKDTTHSTSQLSNVQQILDIDKSHLLLTSKYAMKVRCPKTMGEAK